MLKWAACVSLTTVYECQQVRVYSHMFYFLMSLLFSSLPSQGTGQPATKYAIKTLAVCTAASHLAREELVKSDKSEKWLAR